MVLENPEHILHKFSGKGLDWATESTLWPRIQRVFYTGVITQHRDEVPLKLIGILTSLNSYTVQLVCYRNAGKTSRQECTCSKAHALLAITEIEGIKIWQEREMKRFCWPLFNCCLERVMLNTQVIILCNLYPKKPAMCEFTTILLGDAT